MLALSRCFAFFSVWDNIETHEWSVCRFLCHSNDSACHFAIGSWLSSGCRTNVESLYFSRLSKPINWQEEQSLSFVSPRLTGRQKPGIEIVVDIFCNFKYFKTEIRIKTNTTIIRIHECNPLSFQLWKKRWGGGRKGKRLSKPALSCPQVEW